VTARLPFLAIAAVAAALVLPGVARADLAAVTAFDVPLHGGRSLAARGPHGGFELVGLHWRGGGRVEVRVQRPDGRWGTWLADAEDDDGPDPGSPEADRTRGWRLGQALWVGHATRFEVRVRGRVTRVRSATRHSC